MEVQSIDGLGYLGNQTKHTSSISINLIGAMGHFPRTATIFSEDNSSLSPKFLSVNHHKQLPPRCVGLRCGALRTRKSLLLSGTSPILPKERPCGGAKQRGGGGNGRPLIPSLGGGGGGMHSTLPLGALGGAFESDFGCGSCLRWPLLSSSLPIENEPKEGTFGRLGFVRGGL
jgi:hypothetical protein